MGEEGLVLITQHELYTYIQFCSSLQMRGYIAMECPGVHGADCAILFL